jgi:hypothetical protein
MDECGASTIPPLEPIRVAHDVFISYSSKDKTVADAVCARLEAHGIRCWIAPRDVQPGANYGASIMDAILSSRVMVLVLSANANASMHIPNEIERAVSRGLAVLPFRIEDVQPSKSLDLFIGAVHWLDALTPPLERHLEQLAQSVRRLLPEAARELPLPPPPPPRPFGVFKIVIAAAAVAAVAILGWYLLGQRNDEGPSRVRSQPPPTATPPAAPPERVGQATRAPELARRGVPAGWPRPNSSAADRALVGCWQWTNNSMVIIRRDGTMTAGPFIGRWRRDPSGPVEPSRTPYTFTWPEPVDTLTMSPDGRRLSGGNQYGVQFTASRVSGGPDFPGTWKWGELVTVVVNADGTANLGPLAGSWVLADAARGIYRVTWPPMEDSVQLSQDGTSIRGMNQYGAVVSGTRLASCGDGAVAN